MKETIKAIVRRTGLRRRHVAAARTCCERNVLAWTRKPAPRSVGRILCYHSVGQPFFGVNDVSPERFRRHIELSLEAGHRFVQASEIVRTGGGEKDLAITFDDGMKSVFSTAAPILAEYKVPWSLFVVSDFAEQMADWQKKYFLGWKEIETLAAAGVEIGSHSATHPNFSELESTQVADELGRSRRTIEDRMGITTTSFAIPFGQSMNWPAMAARAAREVGYATVYAQAEETRPEGTVARTFVTGFDADRIFRSLLGGVFDRWEEWF